LSSLASGWGAILPKRLIESGHDFGRNPVGTGPFRFVEWIPDGKIVFEKNADYWMKGYPKVDSLTMHIIIERSVQVQALMAGELDAIYNVNEEDVELLESDPEVVVEKRLTALVMVMAMNNQHKPLDDIRVRQAINHAIDKQKVLDIAYGGGQVVGTFMDSGDPYYEDFTSIYPYDPDKARSLLRSAGVTDDTVLEMYLPQVFEPHVRAGELYQEMLADVGLKAEIRLVDWPTWISDVYRGAKYDLTVIGHTGKLDPDGRLDGYGTERMYVKWVDAEAAALISEAKKITDFDERKTRYHRALEIMANEVPFVFTGTSYRRIAYRSDVKGFRMDRKLDTFDFRFVEK
jgi:peptide/nickel transport system substrate-binding protein